MTAHAHRVAGRLRRLLAAPEPGGTWLCRTALARARLVELDGFLQPAYPIVGLGAVTAIAACVVAAGPWGLLPLAGFLPMLLVVRVYVRRVSKPELLVAPAAFTIAATLAIATAQTGGLSSPLAFWLLVPAVALPTRFEARVVVCGLTVLLGTFLLASFAFEYAGPEAPTARAIGFTSAVLSFATFAAVLAGAEFRYRTASALDQLTGLLNRAALEPRFEELRQQAKMSNAPICLIACDVDRFKQINDTYGHQVGDQVLAGVGRELRSNLRSFELVYRLGGDEFLVVLPGADAERGLVVAERLRTAIDAARPGGVHVTASFGVSAGVGKHAALADLYRRADEALYAAKAAGRNGASRHPIAPVADPERRPAPAGGTAASRARSRDAERRTGA